MLSGYVTTWWVIAGKTPDHLEDALGFERGALRAGYRVYRLAEMVGPKDFEWKDTTRYSGGWSYDADCDEWVQRQDLHRWTLFKRNNFDAMKADAAFDRMLLVGHSMGANVAMICPGSAKTFPGAARRSSASSASTQAPRTSRAHASARSARKPPHG